MTIPSFKGLGVDIVDHKACITIERDFDEGEKRDQWSQAIVSSFTAESVKEIEVDLGKCPIISSTVIAGLVHLYDFTKQNWRQ